MEPGQDSIGNKNGQWQNVDAARSAEAAYQGLYSAKVGSDDTTKPLIALTADSSGNDSTTTMPAGTGPYITLPATQGDSLHVSVYYYARDTTDTMQSTEKRQLQLPITIVPATLPLITATSEGFKPQKHIVAGAGLQLNLGSIFNLFRKRRKNFNIVNTPVINDSAKISFKLIDTANNVVKTWTVSTPVTPVNSGTWTLSSSAFKITLPDSTQAYTIQISLVNNNVSNVFYDTMRIVQNTPSGPIVQEDDYYPFGNLIDGLAYQNTAYDTSQYKYNGKLLDNDFAEDIYDYGARYFDPQIGRMLEIDGLSEKYLSASPYGYVSDNPILFNDPTGDEEDGGSPTFGGTALVSGVIDAVNYLFPNAVQDAKVLSSGKTSSGADATMGQKTEAGIDLAVTAVSLGTIGEDGEPSEFGSGELKTLKSGETLPDSRGALKASSLQNFNEGSILKEKIEDNTGFAYNSKLKVAFGIGILAGATVGTEAIKTIEDTEQPQVIKPKPTPPAKKPDATDKTKPLVQPEVIKNPN